MFEGPLHSSNGYNAVLEYLLGQDQPIAMFSDSGNILAADGKDTLYIAHGNGINVYPFGSTMPSRAITNGITSVVAMAVGHFNGLYVSNGNDVVVYAPGASTPSRTITHGISRASFLTFDAEGRLVVLNSGTNTITIYALNGTEPVRTIGGLSGAEWVNVGPTDTVYVAAEGDGWIKEFDHEGATLSRTITAIRVPLFAGTDNQDNLYVIDGGNVIYIWKFPPGKTQPSQKKATPFYGGLEAWADGAPW